MCSHLGDYIMQLQHIAFDDGRLLTWKKSDLLAAGPRLLSRDK